METLLGEMKLDNKYNRTIKKEDLDTGMEYTIKGIKYFTTKYAEHINIIIDFEDKFVDLFVPKHFDSTAADPDKKFK